MFSILRPKKRINDRDYASYPELLKLPGAILPWQVGASVPVRTDKYDIGNDLHEAGHALARWYEGKKERLLDVDGALKFEDDFESDHAYGVQAGMHEARAVGFSYLLSDAIEKETPDTYNYTTSACRKWKIHAAGFCSVIAYGSDDISKPTPNQDKQFLAEIERIENDFTPEEVVKMWREVCAYIVEGQTPEFMEEAFNRMKEKYPGIYYSVEKN